MNRLSYKIYGFQQKKPGGDLLFSLRLNREVTGIEKYKFEARDCPKILTQLLKFRMPIVCHIPTDSMNHRGFLAYYSSLCVTHLS